MMLLPFTSRSSRTIVISLWNFAAIFTISAAGRACRPLLVDDLNGAFDHQASHRDEDEEQRGRRATSLQPSMRPFRRTTTNAPTATAMRTPPRRFRPGPMIRPSDKRNRHTRGERSQRVRSAPVHDAAPGCRAPTPRAARASSPCAAPTRADRGVRRCRRAERIQRPQARSRPVQRWRATQASRTEANRPTRAGRRRCRAAHRARCGSARCVRGGSPSSSARASAPTATDARYGCALK